MSPIRMNPKQVRRRTAEVQIFLLGRVIILLLILSACTSSHYVSERLLPFAYFYYGSFMRYDFRIIENGEIILLDGGTMMHVTDPRDRFFNPNLREFVIVATEEEADIFPYYVVVGFPHPKYSYERIHALHWIFEYQVQTLGFSKTYEYFALNYPITFDDIIYNWRDVKALFESLGGVRLLRNYNAYIANQNR